MGTRCLTRVFDERKRELLCMLVWDEGWPARHGSALATFLGSRFLVNGLSRERMAFAAAADKTLANGMGCLAAQLVTHFRSQDDEPGFIKLQPPGGDGGEHEEFVYEVRCIPACDAITGEDADPETAAIVAGFFRITCASVSGRRERVLFEGSPAEFLKWLDTEPSHRFEDDEDHET